MDGEAVLSLWSITEDGSSVNLVRAISVIRTMDEMLLGIYKEGEKE